MDNKTVGAQLVKGLSFEVVAIPQDNTIEMKNSSNMTPLNVKVRVRKKDDGSTVLRKGIIAVERFDQPDSPIERLRLANSEQTIMSFNMLMEADLQKNTAAKKPKKNFFGICLGVQGEDDDTQYLPTSDITNKDNSRSDTKVAKLKNIRPIVNTVIVDDTSTSYSSRKRDKLFGKCKPGGCLDPPFGEDKYVYQPQPKGLKSSTTKTDDTQEIKSDVTSGKLQSKIDGSDVTSVTKETDQDNNKSNPVLSLYQGQPKIAVEENDSEYIITYPPTLSSSGLFVADDRNEARRPSGARPSRKSFNEFSAQYFSPPRTPRDSKDSAKNDKEKNITTKEILAPGQIKSIDKSDSKPLGILDQKDAKPYTNETQRLTTGSEIDILRDEAALQKNAPQLRTTSHNRNSDVLSDLENEPNREALKLGVLRVAGIGAATAGVTGLGIASVSRKCSNAIRDQQHTNSENVARNSNVQNFGSTKHEMPYPEHTETTQSGDFDISYRLGQTPLTLAKSSEDAYQDSVRSIERIEDPSKEKSSTKGIEQSSLLMGTLVSKTFNSDLERKGMIGNMKRDSSLTSAQKQYRKDGDFSARGLTMTANSNRGLSHEETLMHEGIDGDRAAKEATGARDRVPLSFTSTPKHNPVEDLSTTGLPTTAISDRSISHMRTPMINSFEIKDTSKEINLTRSIENTPKFEGVGGDYTITKTGSSDIDTPIYKDSNESSSQRGFTTTTSPEQWSKKEKIAGEDQDSKRRSLIEGSDREQDYTSKQKPGTERDLASTAATLSGISGKISSGISFSSKESQSNEGLAKTEKQGMDFELRDETNTGESRAYKSRSKSESLNSNYLPDDLDNLETSEIAGPDKLKRRLKSSNGTEYNDVEYSASGMIITESLNKNLPRTKPKIAGSQRISESYEGEYPYAKGTDVTGNRMIHSRRTDRASDVHNAYETKPEMNDANVASFISDIIRSPSDIASRYRNKKSLNKSSDVGVDIEAPDDILHPTRRQLETWESGQQSESSDGISPYDTGGIYRRNMEPEESYTSRNKFDYETQSESGSLYIGSGGRAEHNDGQIRTPTKSNSQSKESIFLNLAFQTDFDGNQTTVKTLNSLINQDSNNVVLVKSLIRPQDKGVAVKIGSKHVMNIDIKPASVSHLSIDHKARIPKPITKFGSGKSDYSNSGVSLKDIGSDPHAALSVVFHQELVPLQNVIKNLKDDIDGLAAQQTKLRDKLDQRPTRAKQVPRKCGCLKRISSIRTE